VRKAAVLLAVSTVLVALICSGRFLLSSCRTDPKTTVYVTKAWKKYHRDRCRHLSKSKITIPLEEAAKKYEPCSVCLPPKPKAQRAAAEDSRVKPRSFSGPDTAARRTGNETSKGV
jgi:hypothetical protein